MSHPEMAGSLAGLALLRDIEYKCAEPRHKCVGCRLRRRIVMPDPAELVDIDYRRIDTLHKTEIMAMMTWADTQKMTLSERRNRDKVLRSKLAKNLGKAAAKGTAKVLAAQVPGGGAITSAEGMAACAIAVHSLDELNKLKSKFKCGNCVECVVHKGGSTYKSCEQAVEYVFQKRCWKAVKGFVKWTVVGSPLVTGHRIFKYLSKKFAGTQGVMREAHAKNLWFCAVEFQCMLARETIRLALGGSEQRLENALRRNLPPGKEGWRLIKDSLKSV